MTGIGSAATSPDREDLAPNAGDVLSGKYRLLRLLGEGGMGLVFEAEHIRLRQSVAIKFLRPEVMTLPDAVERFEREARASARIRGPHVVRVLDVDTDQQGRPYMVMELLRGQNLEAELRRRGSFSIAGAVDLVLQACVAVAQAHSEGIVHRDLKPSNLFLAYEGGKRVLKVLDFGISKFSLDSDLAITCRGITVGTPLYMSPEQMRCSSDVDGRTDIWSLGVVLYELMAGAPPFLGSTTAAIAAIVADASPSLRDIRPEVPAALERALMTALAKAPADRLPTAEAFAAALVPFASADGVAGPFSVRPSQHDFAVASRAIARTPSTARASDAADLLRPSPTWAIPECSWRDARRTFAITLAIGIVAASGLTFARHRAPRGRTVATPAAVHTLLEQSPRRQGASASSFEASSLRESPRESRQNLAVP